MNNLDIIARIYPHSTSSTVAFQAIAASSLFKDWGSLTGIQVTYDSQGAGKRSKFQWMVGGHEVPSKKTSIVLELHKAISFRIVVPYHDISCPEYIEKVNHFCRGTASAEDLLEDLDLISRPRTQLPTGVNTPDTGAIYVKKRLGEGSFGTVTHLWDVRTGQECALKTPSDKAMAKGIIDIEAWRKEARIMRQVAHPHIVTLLKESFTPKPQLFLEYMPGGSLEQHISITEDETLMILRQGLSALEYLHSQDSPIAHRDIKPANILVKSRTETFIYVKLGDFGVSGDSSELMTMCGTRKYMAPEIHEETQQRTGGKRKRGYNETVDLWSLGVVAYELLDGLPRYAEAHRKDGMAWCKSIVNKLQADVQTYKDEIYPFLLGSVLVISPTSRLSARDAYREAINLSSEGNKALSSGGSSLGSFLKYIEEDEGTIVQRAPEDDTTSLLNPPTMIPASTITTVSPQTQVPADGDELAHFLNNYSSDPLNTLFVGSSLAELGGKEDESGFGSMLGSSAAGLGVEGETIDEALVKDDTGQEDVEEEIG
ncbi:hypothetical protein NCS52_00395200 [Fusarium sp. LHS14.1]|nr:hypothetical protein NCS52_00395200 [Fusarium sp. LHS14.1]